MKKNKSIVILSILCVLIIFGTVFACVSLNNGELGLYNYNAYPKIISLGLDLSGGVYAVYDVDTTTDSYKDMSSDERKAAIEGTRASMETLLFNKGYTEAQVTVSGERIRVEIPDVDDPERIFELIGDPADLEFKEYVDGTNDLSLNDASGSVKLSKKLTGDYVSNAGVAYDSDAGYYIVQLQFNSEGTKMFGTATTALTGKDLAIYINGSCLIHPTVNEAITGGTCSIEGKYSYDDAYNLAVKITAGSFPLTLKMTECSTISATLGKDAIQAGVIAGIVGVVLIMAYLCFLYRFMGVAASLSLWYYVLNFLFFLAVFPWVQLTLAGMAGVLLAIGMAVDANVIIFERIKEEYESGKTLRTSVDTGFKRSLGAILDGNVTTIIGAVVLIILGSSSLRSFGITLLIGIILSLISSLLITRIVLKSIMAFNGEKDSAKFNLFRKVVEETDTVADTSVEAPVAKEEI